MQNTPYQSLKDKIFSYSKLKENYDGNRPFSIVIDKALYIVSIIEQLKFPIPTVSVKNYGILFDWPQMEIEILFDGHIEILYINNKDKDIDPLLLKILMDSI